MKFEFEFEADNNISEDDIIDFEQKKGITLPQDYRLHMLKWNGGGVDQFLKYKDEDGFNFGLMYLYALKNDDTTVISVNNMQEDLLPEGYLIIGRVRGGGDLIMCVNQGVNFGEIKVMEETLDTYYMASSLTQFFESQIVDEEYL